MNKKKRKEGFSGKNVRSLSILDIFSCIRYHTFLIWFINWILHSCETNSLCNNNIIQFLPELPPTKKLLYLSAFKSQDIYF